MQEFQEKGWISRLVNDEHGLYVPTSVTFPIREWSVEPGTNLVSRKFIQCGHPEESEAFTVDVHEVKPLNDGVIQELYIETFWGGWGGLCTVSVCEKIPDKPKRFTRHGERLEPVLIDLSDPSRIQSEGGAKNQRYDYEKGRIHCYYFKYVSDTEYPILHW